MDNNIKKDIDNIVWWIPFKKLRDSLRRLLLNIIELKKQFSIFNDIYILSNSYGLDYKGQIGQDIIAYICLKNKKNGFYIDIGAYDGITLSNTYIFEKLGWNGFCVEANPKTFEKLQNNRKCDCYNYALCSKELGKSKFFTSSIDVLDVLEVHNSDSHRDRIIKSSNNNTNVIEIETTTFEKIMNNYKDVQHIDFMSLDIEGGEFDVLSSIDFNKYSFSLITVEYNDKYNEIKEFMLSKGYKILMKNRFDLIFIKNSNIDF